MKMLRLVSMMLALALLSGCTATEIKDTANTLPDVTEVPAVSEDITTSRTEAATTEATTAEMTTTEASTIEETTTTEATETEATTTTEATATEVTAEVTEEIAEDDEIIEDADPEEVKGTTTDGEEFTIDPDYAFFIVNKQLPLDEDYSIETDYVQGSYELETTAAYYCRLMIEAAKEDGIELKVLSAYRTVRYQKKLFERNVESRMASGMSYDEAYADVSINIAPPGASEHNAGLAVDIITVNDWDTYEGFEDTEEFAWLQENAADFGFIMRYLKGKEDITGYIYEPWHYRYVGTKYAKDVRDSGLCLEEYFEEYVYTTE